MREQQEAMHNLPPGKPPLVPREGKPFAKGEDGEFGGWVGARYRVSGSALWLFSV